ncbi:MAG: FeoB-associated Cys-rich membrane protein [Burkholderiaceae bacterium]
MNYDLMAVLLVGALAVGFLVRRYWRASKGKAPACGNCNNCVCDD